MAEESDGQEHREAEPSEEEAVKLRVVARRAVTERNRTLSDFRKQIAAAQGSSIAKALGSQADILKGMGLRNFEAEAFASNAAKSIAGTRLDSLRKQIAAAQGSSIAKALGSQADILKGMGLRNFEAEAFASNAAKSIAGTRLDSLRKQIAAAQGSSIAKALGPQADILKGMGLQMESAQASVLEELTIRASRSAKSTSLASAAAEASMKYSRWNSFAGTALESLGSQIAKSNPAVRAAAEAATVTNLRGLDRCTPATARLAQFAATSDLAERALGAGALTTWRASLEVDRRIAVSRGAFPLAGFEGLARVAKRQVDLTSWVVRQESGHRLLSDLSGRPVLEWRNRLAETLPAEEVSAAEAALAAGQATLGLVGGDLLTSVAPDDGLAEEVTERVEEEILDPWERARLDVFRHLYEALRALDPTVPELLQGAWDDVHRAGPAAAAKAANCVIEVVDRTFRAAAPDESVRAWHRAENRPKAEWEGQTRPPHALRAKYLARNFGDDRVLVEAQAEAFAAISRRIRGPVQKIKHASRGDIAKVKTLLLSAEYLLVALFLGRDDQAQ
ncbi:hypothetical protein OG711_38720 (plasmid) [Streptomyces uncialis]|uniref:hypothetical protein n=1 Tax=Streptomyces uncialis TaxID=1048205 RepID=UPI002E320BC9|nr:hypothetical protein [Streptomyces uncialis]